MSFTHPAEEATAGSPTEWQARDAMPLQRPDLFISGDVETDGPIPGEFSLLSFGLAAVGTFDGNEFAALPLGKETFYAELCPISDNFEEEALQVNGLDRARLEKEGLTPSVGMDAAYTWITQIAKNKNPVFVGYPAAFDWMWLFWYFVKFSAKGSPFGFSQCLDIKTLIAIQTGSVYSDARKSFLPSQLLPSLPHTHHALDDALSQGELFVHLFSKERTLRNQQ